jgi:hypothetical protein
MSNIFEALLNTFKTYVDNEPKKHLHTGEVTACWLYFTAMNEAIRYEQDGLHTTTDDELMEMLNDAVRTCGSQINKLEQFMLKEGIPLPVLLPSSKPESKPDAIPQGVKMTDDEIANGVSAKVALMILQCASAQAQSVRNDVGLLFVEFHTELLTFGTTLKTLMKKRGWLRVPPYYYPPGAPD